MQLLQSVGVLSCAKIMGAIHAVFGLIIGPIFFLTTPLGTIGGGFGQSALAIVSGLGLMLFLPLFYGALGFGIRAVSAWIYNLAARKFGGIELELRDARF